MVMGGGRPKNEEEQKKRSNDGTVESSYRNQKGPQNMIMGAPIPGLNEKKIKNHHPHTQHGFPKDHASMLHGFNPLPP
jgi:hypothetical protein